MSSLNLPVNCSGLLHLSLSAVFLSSIFEFLPVRAVCASLTALCPCISLPPPNTTEKRISQERLDFDEEHVEPTSGWFKYVGSVSLDLVSQTQIDHSYNINEKEQTGSSALTFVYDTVGRTPANGTEGIYAAILLYHRFRTEVFLCSNF
ncbi:hypothetical protein TSUD_217960 [Trifolium subterraneum]|uniref:Uncharacterized protein n=1 Tax=Trifolium subterraneum TaxID=3900 RepID=A0A2Z6MZ50_TRISU|nr:hypothetical protein TSUD_217960 [Trifolium subterraneum]